MTKAKPKAKFKLSNKAITSIAIVLSVVILASGAGLILGWLQRSPSSTRTSSSNITGFPTTPVSKSISVAQHLEAQGNYVEAQKSISKSLVTTTDKTEKSDLYVEQGVVYENQKDLANAIAAYQNAKAVQETEGVDESIGRVAAELGQKQLAIENYNAAISILNKLGDSRSLSSAKVLQSKVMGLEK